MGAFLDLSMGLTRSSFHLHFFPMHYGDFGVYQDESYPIRERDTQAAVAFDFLQ